MINIKRQIDISATAVIEKIGSLINPWILNFTDENNTLLVFYFHGLYESAAQKDLNHIDPQTNITVEQFADFIDYFLSHNYTFIKPDDLLLGHQKNGKPCIMITFDDGYFNNLLAINVLNNYKIPGVFFITTRFILENRSMWSDIIYKYRIRQGASLSAIRKEQEQLKGYNNSYIDRYIEKNFGKGSIKPWSDIDRPFTKQEVTDISSNPYVVIGNHTHTHVILTNCDEKEIIKEFTESNEILLSLTGSLPSATAFPNGNFNELILKATEDLGFRFAFTTKPGRNIFPINNNFTCFNRFVSKPDAIYKYGTFPRLGYTPSTLYANFKEHLRFAKIFN